jgi:hypothetical protein
MREGSQREHGLVEVPLDQKCCEVLKFGRFSLIFDGLEFYKWVDFHQFDRLD